ncbi:MAG: cupin domain-containing protein [Oxalobacter sp.]|nr:cupin domain-containing protein [Oxalobacter sp.]
MQPQDIITHFGMQPHPEGGYYIETYRSAGTIPANALPDGWGEHNWSTGILYLLKAGDYSHFHRIRQDEMWHFYLGDPMRLAMLYPDGCYEEIILGKDILAGQKVQFTVPAGVWFGATPCKGSEYAFVGCTVAPGFAFADFEIAKKSDLLAAYPDQAAAIDEFGQG